MGTSNMQPHGHQLSAVQPESVMGALRFLERSSVEAERPSGPRVVDYRDAESQVRPLSSEVVPRTIRNARLDQSSSSIETGGFTLIDSATSVTDWFDPTQVTSRYYEECRLAAQALTGASHAFTFDHLIREPGRQTAGGGLDGTVAVTGADRGGGYVNAVHMDYTDNATWAPYLKLHGAAEPSGAGQVIVLNFWRPIQNAAHADPLAVCDARSVDEGDLIETMIYGYGHAGYSWHDIGVAVFEVAASDRHEWFYYPGMTPDETLVFKTYDSAGVIGRTCPHGSFADPSTPDDAPDRRSIELRVLCYLDG
ncbi:MAG: CmcJ/NvfI family oxidoreductase [Acidimicrobiales bacterium]